VEKKRVYGMVLAAGLGTRLRPLTDTVPKPAVQVAGKPLIFYALLNMQKIGVSRVVINTHYLPQKVISTVQSSSWPFEIVFVNEPEILGTGGAIRNAQEHLSDCDAIITHNSDSIVNFDFNRLLEAHFENAPLSTMLLKEVEDPDSFGAISTDRNDRVRDIVGALNYAGPVHQRRMYCGVQVFGQELFDWMPATGSFCILRNALIPAIKADAFVRAVENTGFFCDVGTMERLDFANRYFTTESSRENISF
jgi:mannose-1-phosphate guanylyltransferase